MNVSWMHMKLHIVAYFTDQHRRATMLGEYVPNANIHDIKQGDLNLVSSPALFNNTFLYESHVMVQYYMKFFRSDSVCVCVCTQQNTLEKFQ